LNRFKAFFLVSRSSGYKYQRCLFFFAFALITSPLLRAASLRANPDLDELVHDVCGKSVVVLGEDANHGSGNALTIKADIVQRLVDRCGFSGVLFESPIYDALDLERAYSAHTATQAQLANAIGGIWSVAGEFDPLVTYLHDKITNGRVRFGGVDMQAGSATSTYQEKQLASDLTISLPEAERAHCEREIDRNINWEYTRESPYDEGTLERLRSCARAVENSLPRESHDATAARNIVLAFNLSKFFQFQNATGMPDAPLRDKTMYENFVWYQKTHWPAGTKIIVWTATIHGAKQSLPPGAETMGSRLHQLLGNRLAVIGFSAFSGSYGRQTQSPKQLSAALQNSLEARVLSDSAGNDLRYIDSARLRQMGSISARVLSYDTFASADWSHLLDGMVVFKQEHPLTVVRKAIPQQSAQ
jgi:erythromycin esterase-like protein